MTVGKGVCTICEEEYSDCPHIKTYPYDGEFCTVRIEDIVDTDHVAIVDEPADKRARAMITGERDTMTNLPIDELDPDRELIRSAAAVGEEEDTDSEE